MEHVTLRPARADVCYADRPVTERRQFVLPAIPDGASSKMRELVDRYATAWVSPVPNDDEGDLTAERWHEAARAIQMFEPSCDADNLAKLIVAIHYRDPEGEAGSLEIDAPDAPEDRRAVEMELGCLDWFLARQRGALSWDKALVEYRRSRDIHSGHASHTTRPGSPEYERLEAEADVLLDFTTAKLDALIATPCPDLAAVLTKIEICQQEYDLDSSAGGMIEKITDDFRRLLDQAQVHLQHQLMQEDPKLVTAFETYRQALREMKVAPDDLTDAAAAPFFARMDPADMVMKETSALTVPGAIMKLKRAFSGLIEERWADCAVFDQRPAEFAKGLDMTGIDQQLLWSAIEDLERIASGARSAAPTASDWQLLLDTYRAARAVSDETPTGDPEEDARVDAYCELQDKLFATRAPSHADLILKIEMMNQRFEGLCLSGEQYGWIADDIRHLAAKGEA